MQRYSRSVRPLGGAAGRLGHMTELTASQAIAAFPRRKARTLRFTSGAPRSAQAIGDGTRALFLRSDGPEDLVTALWLSVWSADGTDHREVLLADPRRLLADADSEEVSEEEKARRERAREGGQGIVSYSVDAAGRRVVFTINGQLFLTEIKEDGTGGVTREVALADPQLSVIMPRISPDGQLIAYTTGSEVRVIALGADASQDEDWAVIGIDEDECTYPDQSVGLAEFVAGEEMDRYEGFWWSPDSRALLVQSTDEEPEPLRYISGPAEAGRGPPLRPRPDPERHRLPGLRRLHRPAGRRDPAHPRPLRRGGSPRLLGLHRTARAGLQRGRHRLGPRDLRVPGRRQLEQGARAAPAGSRPTAAPRPGA